MITRRVLDALTPYTKVLVAEGIFIVAFTGFAFMGMPWAGLGCSVAYLGFIGWCLSQ